MRFKLPEVPANASFSGKFDEKAVQLSGNFSQAGQSFPMNLQRASALEKAAEAKRPADAVAAFRQLADSLRLKRHTPGMAIGVIKDGVVLLNDGFGYRDLDKKLPATANTLFAIGSSSKAFTTAGLSVLADQGALDWEKPVVQYMPDFKLYDDFATREINAIDLTCHRSGLPRHDLMWYGSDFTRQQVYERLRYLKPNKSLRTTFQYNNLMFMSAGCLIEKLSGKTWEDFTRENLFVPLGMTNSNFSVKDLAKSKESALGYRTKDDKNTKLDYRNLDAIGPAGSINSTTTDMLQWVKLHLGNGTVNGKKVLSADEITRLHTPQMLMDASGLSSTPELKDPSYALGWMTYRHRGLKVVEHGGNIDGFSALVYMVPEKDFGIVVLTNQDGAGILKVLAGYATDMFLGLETTDWYNRFYGDDGEEEDEETPEKEVRKMGNTVPSRSLAGFAGTFEHPGYGKITVKETATGLRVQFNGFDLPLEHWHYDVFSARDTMLGINMMLNFASDPGGIIYQVSTSLDPTMPDEVFQKVAPSWLSDPAYLKKLAGKYTFAQGGVQTCQFEARNATLYVKVPGQPEYTLVPFDGNEFKLKGLSGYSVAFTLDAQGKAVAVSFIQPQGIFKANRAD
jgi:CubicO group peptidase (beta-lactamase class C family)